MSLEAVTTTDWVRRSGTTVTVSSRFILWLWLLLPEGCCCIQGGMNLMPMERLF